MAGIVWLIIARTVFGTEARAAGFNARAAEFAGVSLPRTIMGVALLSGGLAGLAGGIEVAGVTGGVTTTMSPGFGYCGNRRGNAGRVASGGSRCRVRFCGHGVCWGGCDEPGHGSPVIYC